MDPNEPELPGEKLYSPDGSEAVKTTPKPSISIKKNLVYVGIVLVLVIMGFIYIMAQLINVNSQCTNNPFVYGASVIESSRGDADPICSCTTQEEIMCACALSNSGKFWFDDEQIYPENPYLERLGFNSPLAP